MTDSTAIRWLQFMWDHVQERTGHSWLKMNHAMREALVLAVKAGMEFGKEDFLEMQVRFRSGYWLTEAEGIYTTAVIYRNASAYRAYEFHRGRKAFIVKGARVPVATGDGPAGGGLARLVVGARFEYEGVGVVVTSFNDAAGVVVACAYEGSERRLVGRFRLTHDDLRLAGKGGKRAG